MDANVKPDKDYRVAAMQQRVLEGKVKNLMNRMQSTGRNEPCPCGSGKKFKKCCWITYMTSAGR